MLDNCYFINVVSMLAKNEERIWKLFGYGKLNKYGVYAVNLIKNGRKIKVVVDDFIPP